MEGKAITLAMERDNFAVFDSPRKRGLSEELCDC
jgi:hypothetical protein